MHNEFDIIFELVLGFFVDTIILLVILIRLDQPRDRLHLRSSHRTANRSTIHAPRPARPRKPSATDGRHTEQETDGD
jgi:hypothetical protein